MMFIVKFALVMYFALGNAWHTIFFNGIYGLSNSMSEFIINLNKDHAKIVKINSIDNDQIEIDVEDYGSAYQLISGDREAYKIQGDGRNLFKINNLDEYPSVNNKWFIATGYDYDTEEGSSDSNPGKVIITAKP